jgi:dihydroxy-acid dehydratase
MSCPQADTCNQQGNCQHASAGGIEDIEDYKTELSTLRARTKELEEKLAKLTTSSDKTLRSSKWLNRADDKAMSALYREHSLRKTFL